MNGDTVSQIGIEGAVRLLTGADFWSLHDEPALGLRRIVTSDGPAGVRGELWDERDPSLTVPCPTALAASWDVELLERTGELLAGEARRKGADVLLGPTLNIQRTPVGGRHFECFSEDPVLTARLGVAYVRGVQRHGVAATAKHVVGNDFERQRLTADVEVDERTLRELYLLPFEAAVREAGVWAVMAAYNSINGTTMTEHPLLGVLRDEWGFDGVLMSDWFATRSLDAVHGQLDLAMPGPGGPWGEALVAALAEGTVPAERVAEKLRRILLLAERVGALNTPGPARPANRPSPPPESDEAGQLRRTAAAGFVLLRNAPVADRPVLPLDPAARVVLIGEHATTPRILGGGSAFVFPVSVSTPADGLGAVLPGRLDVLPGVATGNRIGLPAPGELWTVSEGTRVPGVAIAFLGDDGELGRDLRTSTVFNWNTHFVDGVPAADVRAVEVRTTYRASRAGTHVLGCSGVGRHRMWLDGREVIDAHLELAPDADGVEGLTRPPQAGHALDLDAGAEVEVLVRREVVVGPGEPVIVALQLNVSPPHPSDDDAIRAAELAAAGADVAVVVVGTTEESEGEGFDRDDLHLAGRQDELVSRVAAANPRTVVVVNSGAPVLLPWRGEVAAVLASWLPGQEFGTALADVLLGVVEPGGRLPVTWPADADDPLPTTHPENGMVRYSEGLHVGHRRYLRDGVAPAYWFGHGLGYTTWAYDRLEVTGSGVVVELRNTGDRAGREVVQVYLARPDSALDRPRRWLAGFAPVTAGPGEAVTVEIALPARAFAHWDGGWAVEPGAFEVLVGPNVDAVALRGEITPGQAAGEGLPTR